MNTRRHGQIILIILIAWFVLKSIPLTIYSDASSSYQRHTRDPRMTTAMNGAWMP